MMVGGATLVSRLQSCECDWVLIIPDYSQESPEDHHNVTHYKSYKSLQGGQAGD